MYTIICEQNREQEVYYNTIGSYQWEWMLFSYKDGLFLYREWGYGSCSGCDDYESTFSYYDPVIDSEKVIEFVNRYPIQNAFTLEQLLSYKEKNTLLYGFIPVSAGWWHEEWYDQEIIKGLEACLNFFPATTIAVEEKKKAMKIFQWNSWEECEAYFLKVTPPSRPVDWPQGPTYYMSTLYPFYIHWKEYKRLAQETGKTKEHFWFTSFDTSLNEFLDLYNYTIYV